MKHVLATTILCVTVGLGAAGCGGSEKPAAAAADQPQTQQSDTRGPDGSGKVTEVSGSTAQVQGRDAQVAVSWTARTTFTQQVEADASAVKAGACVMVTPTDSSTASTDTVSAATVRITKPTNGSCAPQGGRLRTDGGQQGDPPKGKRPTNLRSGGPGPGRGGGFAIGEVKTVTSTGFTVSSQRPGSNAKTTKTTTVKVSTADDTTYTTTAKASAADVKVGVCVTSRGDPDDTGAITATAIALSSPVDGECAAFFAAGRRSGQS